jgi:Protein of unknown function (DUF3352)
MRTRAVLLLPLLALAFAAGCGSSGGGGGGSVPDAASIVPADALAYATVNTDTGSDQLKSAQSIIDKFPIKQKALASLKADALKNGVDIDTILGSVGPVVDVAVLKVGTTTGPVGFAKPSDEQTFDAQLKDLKHTTVDGWTVFAKTQAFLDAVTGRTANLADDATYKDALSSIPSASDAVARIYAPGASLSAAATAAGGSVPGGLGSLTKDSKVAWITGALTSKDGSSANLETHFKETSTPSSNGTPVSLADEIPSDALLALSLSGGTINALPAGTEQQLGQLTQQLGVDISSLIGILQGPVIAYVTQGTPIPEVTLAAVPPDAAGASNAISALMTKLVLKNGGSIKKVAVSGVQLNTVNVGPIALYWGTYDGKLVLTDNPSALGNLKNGPSSKLLDDSTFKDTASSAGMPDQNQGFLYIDAKDALPMIEGIATIAGTNIPADVQANLQPLKALLLYGSRDGAVQTGVVNVQTN